MTSASEMTYIVSRGALNSTHSLTQWMTSDINNSIVSHCFLFTMALKGMEPAPNQQQQGGRQKLEGGSFKFVTPAPQHEGK